MLAIQGIHSSCLFHTLTRDLVKCVGITGNPLKLFISYLNESKMCWQYRVKCVKCALQGILSSCLFHTLTRDLVKCVGNTGNPLKLFISYLNERSCKMCWHYRFNPPKLFVSYLHQRSCKMCWHYRESSQVVYFIP